MNNNNDMYYANVNLFVDRTQLYKLRKIKKLVTKNAIPFSVNFAAQNRRVL